MRDTFHHEKLYRGTAALARLAQVRLAVCGAGAVGSNLVDNLARQGFRRLTVIDSDRVEAHNANTQTYAAGDTGAFKVNMLQAEVYRAIGVEIVTIRQRLVASSVRKLLAGADLVVDGFDNHASRALVTQHCRTEHVPCLHVGLGAGYAEILWNDGYRVPDDATHGDAGPCNYPLARNLVQFAVALASETLVRYILEGRQDNYTFTLGDLQINHDS